MAKLVQKLVTKTQVGYNRPRTTRELREFVDRKLRERSGYGECPFC